MSEEEGLLDVWGDPKLNELKKRQEWGLSLVHELPKIFRRRAAYESSEEEWKNDIATIKTQLEQRTVTTIGIIGSTGSGKSSFMNAILGYESIVPTSCMRACTAVVTEIAFNPKRV